MSGGAGALYGAIVPDIPCTAPMYLIVSSRSLTSFTRARSCSVSGASGGGAFFAGGGIRGGNVIGATDDFGFQAIEDKVHVNDLHATMLSLMGMNHEELTFHFEGRDRRLTDVGGHNDLAERLVM